MNRYLRAGLLLAAAAAFLCTCVLFYILTSTHARIYSSVEDVPAEQVALVLGASVASNGTLSAVMKERADKSVELYFARKVSKILVTGDNATLTYDEVYPVGKYLAAMGIPQQDIFLDYAGFDTYSSMYRARDVFGVTSMIIVSQQYHLPRSLFIAQSLGITAVGVDASHGESYVLYSLREVPASLKAASDLLFARVPKYLGVRFPVTGDGRATWVGSQTEMVYFSQ